MVLILDGTVGLDHKVGMLKLKRHHTMLLVLAVIFVIAWSVWTLVLLPKSETPNLPDPAANTAPVTPSP